MGSCPDTDFDPFFFSRELSEKANCVCNTINPGPSSEGSRILFILAQINRQIFLTFLTYNLV